MKYKVIFSKECTKELLKLDKYTRTIILNWISKNLNDCENPRAHGKALSADLKGYWRYRIGDYRLICEILDANLLIYSLKVGHRKEIYKK